MAHEFVARKGIISSGSINVYGSVTASQFVGDGSKLTNIIAVTATSSSIGVDTYAFVGDGTTTQYIVSQSYFPAAVFVSVEGLTLTNLLDYTITDQTASFVVAPPSQSNILIRALLNVSNNITGSFSGSFIGDGSGLHKVRTSAATDAYLFVGDGITTSYQVSRSYAEPSVTVTVGGLTYAYPDDYSVSNSTILFVEPPASASNILIKALISTAENVTGSFSGSFVGDGVGLVNVSATTASFVEYGVIANKPTLVSSSAQIVQLLPSGSISASAASSPSQGTLRVTINGVNTDVDTGLQSGDSPTFAGLTVNGAVTAKEFYTQVVSSSIIYQSGSTKFGDSDDDVMSVTGSLIVSGSGTFKNIGPSQFSGSVSTTTDMFIGGNVGIGQTNPVSLINGTLANKSVEIATSGSVGLRFSDDRGTVRKFDIGISGSDAYIGAVYSQTPTIIYDALSQHTFKTNNSTQVIINSSGNVGIGTISPSDKLDVNGQVIVRQSGASVGGPYSFNINNTIGSPVSTRLAFGTDDTGWQLRFAKNVAGTYTDYITLTDSGNVGIGTTSPIATLHVSGSDTGFRVSGTTRSQIILSTPTTNWQIETPTSTGNVPAGAFAIVQGGVGTRFMISGSGNVGIGTTNPLEKLEITGGNLRLSQGRGGAGSFGKLEWQNTLAYSSTVRAYIEGRRGTNDDGYIDFATSENTDVAPVVRMTVNNSGNVGIGTSTPTVKLEVSGAIKFAANTYLYGGNNPLIASNGSTFNYGYTGTTALAWLNNSDTAELMRLTNGGNLGIGTTNPTARLQVAGAGNSGNFSIRTEASSIINPNNSGVEIIGAQISVGGNIIISERQPDTAYSDRTDLAFVTNTGYGLGQSEKMRLTAGGNLGIGTSSPSALLDVRGNGGASGIIQFGNASGLGDLTANGTATYIGSFSLHPLYLKTNNTTRAAIDTSGNFGIGTTSPQSSLHVAGDIRFGTNGVYTDLRTFTDTALSGYNQTNTITPTTVPGGGTAISALYLKTAGSGPGYNRLDLITDGRIGIGTTLPLNLLHIEGSNAFARISNPSTGDGGLKISYQNSDTHGLHLSYNPGSAISYIDNTYPTSSGTVYGDIYFRQNINGTMTSRMMIQAQTGNVGINVIPVNAKLEVVATSGEIFRADAASGAYRIVANQTGVMMNGNVGIGTTTPSQKLQIVGTLAAQNGVDVSDKSGVRLIPGLNSGSIQLVASDGSSKAEIRGYDNGFGPGLLSMWTANASATPTERMRIDSSGNVLIGTTNPDVGGTFTGSAFRPDGQLLVSNNKTDSISSYVYYGDRRGTNNTGPVYTLAMGGYLKADIGIAGTNATTDDGVITFNTISGNATRTERMRIQYNGNVGIGVTSPNGNLQFPSTTNTRKIVLYEGGNNNYQFYGFGVESNTLVYSTYTTTDDHVFFAGTSSTTRSELMRIKGDGKVRIGDPNNGAYRLNITDGAGTMLRMFRSTSNTVEMFTTSTSTTVFYITTDNSQGVSLTAGNTSWGSYSDARLKNITSPIVDALNGIAQIEPVKFTWKNDTANKPHVGVLAQSVISVVPEAVDVDENGMMSVRYTELIPLLIKAVQELKEENVLLAQRVAQLENIP